MSTSREKTKVDWTNKANIARESFKEVLAWDQHEDGKAQRILTAMVFLTAAAGVIFAELSRAEIGGIPQFSFLQNLRVFTRVLFRICGDYDHRYFVLSGCSWTGF